MAVAVLTITPGRGRPGDLLVIAGSGFSAALAQNSVTIGGITAGINSATPEELVVVAPAGLAVDEHLEVEVTNLDDSTDAIWHWWSKPTPTVVASQVLRTKIPDAVEILRGLSRDIRNMNTAEARFFERLASKIELVPDILSAKGDFWSKAAAPLGIRKASAGTAGQPFVSGIEGGRFQARECWTMTWGKTITAAALTEMMNAGEIDTSGTNVQTYNVVPFSGQLALVSVRERISASSRINRIEVLVDDVVVKDLKNGDPEFPGPGLRADSLTFYPGIVVAQGARVQVRISRNNITTTTNCLAYGLVV